MINPLTILITYLIFIKDEPILSTSEENGLYKIKPENRDYTLSSQRNDSNCWLSSIIISSDEYDETVTKKPVEAIKNASSLF